MLTVLNGVIATLVTRLASDERGQSAVEYGMILALIAVVSVGLYATVGGQVVTALNGLIGSF